MVLHPPILIPADHWVPSEKLDLHQFNLKIRLFFACCGSTECMVPSEVSWDKHLVCSLMFCEHSWSHPLFTPPIIPHFCWFGFRIRPAGTSVTAADGRQNAEQRHHNVMRRHGTDALTDSWILQNKIKEIPILTAVRFWLLLFFRPMIVVMGHVVPLQRCLRWLHSLKSMS